MNNYNGILIVNKQSGITSRDVVNIVGKPLNTKKVSHTGTLDPMATRVLVLCLGNALKVCELITANDKEYIAKVILGIETETLDTTSPIINTKKTNITKEEIEKALKEVISKKFLNILQLKLMEKNYMNMLEKVKK